MKQINLLPRKTERDAVFIHPFWKRYAIGSLLVLTASLGFPAMYAREANLLGSSAERIEQWRSAASDQQTWFLSLAERKKSLEATLQSLNNQAQRDRSAETEDSSTILSDLAAVIDRLPEGVWLSNIDCDYAAGSIRLTGYSQRKDDIQALGEDDASAPDRFHNFIIESMKRMDDKPLYEFVTSFDIIRDATETS
ncbi:MAG: hypothetical protein GC154_05640 [bacterium]|nr:hypothetical protein [bacterium]